MSSNFLHLLLILVITVGSSSAQIDDEGPEDGLQSKFYENTCPQVEGIVRSIVWNRVSNNSALPAKLLRLFYHDCFVRGCDASVLIDSVNGTSAEKDAIPNRSLSGFDVIDEVKTVLEEACPDTVSCADILALAARDSISFQFNESLWKVQTGRRDGTISLNQEAIANLPSSSSNFSELFRSFSSKGLTVNDLVILSGAHTIGVAHCGLFTNRLYNFTGNNDTDPSLNPTYAAFLKTKCTNLRDFKTTVPMDPDTVAKFDGNYFVILKQNEGLFQSDAALLTNQIASKIVDKLQDEGKFFKAFGNSIKRMGAIQVLTGTDGKIRKNCRVAN